MSQLNKTIKSNKRGNKGVINIIDFVNKDFIQVLNTKQNLLKIINDGNIGMGCHLNILEILNLTRKQFANAILSIQELSTLKESEIKQIHKTSIKITTPITEKQQEKNDKINKMIYDTGEERLKYDGIPKICEINGVKYLIFGKNTNNITIVTKKIGNIYETINPKNNTFILFNETSGQIIGLKNKLLSKYDKDNSYYPWEGNEIFIFQGKGIFEKINKSNKYYILKNKENANLVIYDTENKNLEELIEFEKGYYHTNTKPVIAYNSELNQITNNIKNSIPIFKHGNGIFAFNGREVICLNYYCFVIMCKSFEIATTRSGKNVLITRKTDGKCSIFDCDTINSNFDSFFYIVNKEIELDIKEFNKIPRQIPDKIKIKGRIRKVKI